MEVLATRPRLVEDKQVPQHCHQCSWCGRFFGEFLNSECVNGHVVQKCCAECERSDPGRLLDMNNKIANANREQVRAAQDALQVKV